MKIRMLTSMSGPKISLNRGDAHECDDDEAQRLIDAGAAEPFDAAPTPDDAKLEAAAAERAASIAADEAAEKATADQAEADAAALAEQREADAAAAQAAAEERAAEKAERLAADETRQLDLGAEEETAVDPQIGKETRKARKG